MAQLHQALTAVCIVYNADPEPIVRACKFEELKKVATTDGKATDEKELMQEAGVYAKKFITKSLGDNVALYTILTEIIVKLIDNRAKTVMREAYFERTHENVRGLIKRVHALTGKNLGARRYRADGTPLLADIEIPPMLFTLLKKCLAVRFEVAGKYERDFERTGDTAVGEGNRRHRFFRDQLQLVLEELEDYKSLVDGRKAAKSNV